MDTKYSPLLDRLLTIVGREKASDLHVSAGRLPIIRVNRELVPLSGDGALSDSQVFSLLVEMVGQEKAELVHDREEIDFSFHFKGDVEVRLRGNAFMSKEKVGIALRVIQEIRTLEELNLPEKLAEFSRKAQGFFLIVGPTGHGKSTTMAALIDLINKERKEHIVTIENPIEYLIEDNMSFVDQREVDIDTEGFGEALKSAFRQDIDVLMVGEMRDPVTIGTAITAAETGHLVFSTLHTNDASQTIDRIIDSFPGEQQRQIRNQLSGSLIGIFSQRLIPSQQGGLVPAYELLINNNATANLIREGRTHEIASVIETSLDKGMVDMNHSILELIRTNKITIEDGMKFSNNPQVLQQLL